MKILILANNDIGLYNFRKELIAELINKGEQVYISLPKGEKINFLKDLGCKFIETEIERRGKNPFHDLKLLFKYMDLINKVNPNYILTYTIKPNIYGGIACRIKRKKYISTITGLGTAFHKKGFLQLFVTLLYKLSLRKARNVIFENDFNKELFLKNKIINEPQAILASGAGVNLQEFGFTPLPATNIIRFLFMGRIMKEKGVDELFEAAERIKNEYYNVEFDILWFLEENYEEKIDNLTNRNIINYYGFQVDVKQYIARSHCIVLPSYHEGMSNTLLEAGAMGRPIITCDIPGCRETVISNQNGYLCRVKDSESLYTAIKDFIELSFEEKKLMGKKSRDHIVRNFDRLQVVELVCELIDM